MQNNQIRTKIDNMQQNCMCCLCEEKDEYDMISECSKLAQKKYKTWHDWAGKTISENCAKY